MCSCIDITPGSLQGINQMVRVSIPDHMHGYAAARMEAGLSQYIYLDPCLVSEIFILWSVGVKTMGSCCGHNTRTPFVNVHPDSIPIMERLGYHLCHSDQGRKDTFRLKTI